MYDSNSLISFISQNRAPEPRTNFKVHFQWIPSHIDVKGKKNVEHLVKVGTDDPLISCAPDTHVELFSKAKSRKKNTWTVLPQHYWFQSNHPYGGFLTIGGNRQDQTILTLFLCGHLRSLTRTDGVKCYTNCTMCTTGLIPILENLGLSKPDLSANSLLILNF
ncbi:RNase H domain-containing protein [Trichonephila clavata]|uniref:RNase H domain-containing protein n=1 Tax=Trichonephila clavata TaxID=2740835 RepID=A0A8X6GZ25_TRICU|nr:RNase H domain-containing protein [Trichonephila clavata]